MTSRTVVLCAVCVLLAPVAVAAAPAPSPVQDRAEAVDLASGDRFLEPLALGLAQALGSDGFRQSLFEELESSPYVEGRLAFKRWLSSNPDLRQELLWQTDVTAGWERVAEALPELELYFPVEAHRVTWGGAPTVWVAVPVDEPGQYRFFAPDGSRGTFEGTEPPEVPTLLLAPSEIDFDDPASALEGGERTGTYLRKLLTEAPVEVPPSGAFDANQIAAKVSGVDNSRHTYLWRFQIYGDHDPFRGSMEIEVFGSVDGSYKRCERFTGIDENKEYWLPYPSQSGSRKIAYAVPTGTNRVDVQVYEDDDTGCVIKGGDDYLGVANLLITQYGGAYGTSNGEAAVAVLTQNTTCGDSVCEGDESRTNCCGDCAVCGDGACSSCEDGYSCSADCYVCGDGICERTKGEDEYNCSADCDSCGNGFCEPGEDYLSCPFDCCDPEGPLICPE